MNEDALHRRITKLEETFKNVRFVGDGRINVQGSFQHGFSMHLDVSGATGGGGGTPPPTTKFCYTFVPGDGNWWAYFWPTYNRSATPPGANTIYYFRHFCLRGVLVDYDQDANTSTVVQAYAVAADDVGIWWSFVDPISWYFTPSTAALDELIAATPFDTAPPSSGTIRLSIYMEMHREYVAIWEPAIFGGMPTGGKHFTNFPDRSANLVGDETTSVPAILKVCWELPS